MAFTANRLPQSVINARQPAKSPLAAVPMQTSAPLAPRPASPLPGAAPMPAPAISSAPFRNPTVAAANLAGRQPAPMPAQPGRFTNDRLPQSLINQRSATAQNTTANGLRVNPATGGVSPATSGPTSQELFDRIRGGFLRPDPGNPDWNSLYQNGQATQSQKDAYKMWQDYEKNPTWGATSGGTDTSLWDHGGAYGSPGTPPGTAFGPVSPAMGGTGGNPYDDEVAQAERDYASSFYADPEILGTEAQLAGVMSNTRLGYDKIEDTAGERNIPLSIIRGQQERLEKQGLALSEPIQQKLARLQAARIASQNASKFSLERADSRAKSSADENKFDPVAVGEGQSIVDPKTGKVLYSSPKTYGPQSLGEGQILIDPATGRQIANNPRVQEPADNSFTLSEGQTRFDANGNPIAAVAPAPKNPDAANDPNRILSPAEAQTLGVPFGTTAGQAYGRSSTKL